MGDWDCEEIKRGGPNRFKWSLITETDKKTIRVIVESRCDFAGTDTVSFLEIGTYNGATAWAVKELVEAKGKRINYWGVDIDSHGVELWPEATRIIGDSLLVFPQVPDGFDILFIDGPHDSSHCCLDFLHYAPKVKSGGFILFHDASPASQCKLPFSEEKIETYRKGGWEVPTYHEFGTAVTVALEKLGLSTGCRTDYQLITNNWTEENYGGISVYRKK